MWSHLHRIQGIAHSNSTDACRREAFLGEHGEQSWPALQARCTGAGGGERWLAPRVHPHTELSYGHQGSAGLNRVPVSSSVQVLHPWVAGTGGRPGLSLECREWAMAHREHMEQGGLRPGYTQDQLGPQLGLHLVCCGPPHHPAASHGVCGKGIPQRPRAFPHCGHITLLPPPPSATLGQDCCPWLWRQGCLGLLRGAASGSPLTPTGARGCPLRVPLHRARQAGEAWQGTGSMVLLSQGHSFARSFLHGD